ncbi:ATP-binding protein [Microcoleus sp. FACHB-672]|uniref:ATP-binding protein n=1 Tax=Microcoleus sp. FACHB-672 TaxID=2692825 RepID=UPI001689B23B|nr:ATP-binding protein [Microcoleus sp. FACHB-672]MBD2040653.1 ATP-binding protein [Microcoleus sp. FACHB-672]
MSFPNTHTIASIRFLQRQAASLLLYQNVLAGIAGQTFLNLLQALHQSDASGTNCLQAYGSWFKALAAKNQSWQNYLIAQILKDENPFTQQAQKTELASLPPALIAAAQHDLQALQSLYYCSGEQLSRWVQTASGIPDAPIVWDYEQNSEKVASELPIITFLQTQSNWSDALETLTTYYQKYSIGLFADARAVRWDSGKLVKIPHPDSIKLNELTGYELQRETLLKNTEFLLAGFPALHVLLYGSRGSGKSSLVKALLNECGERGLRLVEVAKSDMKDLPAIVEQLRDLPQKFIIFVDDLSFEEDDDAFKALKVVLEGNITARPQNVIVYATSNRRHLIREFFDDRPRPSSSEEVHAWDTVQEKLSFSDRFGLTLTFEPANQDTYLKIVRHLAMQAGINLSQEDLDYKALQWATRHNGRSGRTARQFVDFLKAELAIAGQLSKKDKKRR